MRPIQPTMKAILPMLGLALVLVLAGCDNGNDGPPPLREIHLSPADAREIYEADRVLLTAARVPAEADGEIAWETDPRAALGAYVEFDINDCGTQAYLTGLRETAALPHGRVRVRAISDATFSDWVEITVKREGPPPLTGITLTPDAAQTIDEGHYVSLTAARVPAQAAGKITWETYPPAALGVYVGFDISDCGTQVYVTGLRETRRLQDNRVGVRAVSGDISGAWVHFTVEAGAGYELFISGQTWMENPNIRNLARYYGNHSELIIAMMGPIVRPPATRGGSIQNGWLRLGFEDSPATLEDIGLMFFVNVGELFPWRNVDLDVTDDEARAAWLRLSTSIGGTIVKRYAGDTEGGNPFYDSLHYIYVDRDVTISAKESVTGGFTTETLQAFSLDLEAGWNAIHLRFEHLSYREVVATITLAPGNRDHMRWVAGQAAFRPN